MPVFEGRTCRIEYPQDMQGELTIQPTASSPAAAQASVRVDMQDMIDFMDHVLLTSLGAAQPDSGG